MPGTATTAWISTEFDADAQAFITAAGITDATQQGAINTLVVAGKTNGWWTKCIAIYPFVGGTATTHKYNLKDPRDLDAAYRLTFPNGATHSANGVDWDGVNQYANTQLVPLGTLNVNSTHMSYYCRENVAAALEWEMGCYNPIGVYFRLILKFVDSTSYSDVFGSGGGANVVSDTRGWFVANREVAANVQMYQNGSQIRTIIDAANSSQPNCAVLIGANWDGTTFSGYSTKQCAFATVGDGLTSTILSAMYTDIQNFQTTLGRQV